MFDICCYSAILSPISYSGKMSPIMTRKEIQHITKREMKRLIVITKLIERLVSLKEASEVLGLSTMQVLRIKKGVIKIGR